MRPRSKTQEVSQISAAVAALRHGIGQTQAEFAKTMGVRLTSVARWETSQTPASEHIPRFKKLACQYGLSGLEDFFYAVGLGTSPGYRYFLSDSIKSDASFCQTTAEMLFAHPSMAAEFKERLANVAGASANLVHIAELLDPRYVEQPVRAKTRTAKKAAKVRATLAAKRAKILAAIHEDIKPPEGEPSAK